MIKDFFKLIRVKHYTKNALIFAALVFSGQLTLTDKLKDCAIAFVVFCLVSSVIYIVNDIKDKDTDRLHAQKCKRPIASGRISVKAAAITAIICLIIAGACFAFIYNTFALVILIIYLVINILYSYGLKNIPLLDVTILVSGFLIRVIYGAVITDIEISNWLYLTVMALSFFMAFGKRRNELKKNGPNTTRKVLKGYSIGFLDKSMYMCLTMANTFYALWTIGNTNNNQHHNYMIITVPVVLLITLKYCLSIENVDSDGDPTEVLFNDKALLLLCMLYAVLIIFILYWEKFSALLRV